MRHQIRRDILLQPSHPERARNPTPFVITSSPGPSSDASQVSLNSNNHLLAAQTHLFVTDDSNGGACSTSPGGNNGEGRAVPTWPEQNTQGGATSPEPQGVMNAAEESGSKSNVQVWKLDANTEQDSNDPGCQQQALQSFTLQETLFVEQLAAIDERVRNQVCVCVFEITFLCRRSILTSAYVRSQ